MSFFVSKDKQDTEHIIAEQFVVIDAADISSFRKSALEDGLDAARWAEAWARVEKSGHVLRVGHLFWTASVVTGNINPGDQVPEFEPPADWPYSLRNDPQSIEVKRGLRAEHNGELMTAVACYERAALAGSPAGMLHYGSALVFGKRPGTDPDPETGLLWVERAIEAGVGGSGLATVGEWYLSGEGLPHDPVRGMDYLRRAHEAGLNAVEMRLADVLYHGLHGVPADRKAALDWAANGLPDWAKAVRRRGWFSFTGLITRRIKRWAAIREQISNMSQADMRRALNEIFG